MAFARRLDKLPECKVSARFCQLLVAQSMVLSLSNISPRDLLELSRASLAGRVMMRCCGQFRRSTCVATQTHVRKIDRPNTYVDSLEQDSLMPTY